MHLSLAVQLPGGDSTVEPPHQERMPRRALRADKDELEAWLNSRTPAERRQLAGQALAYALGLSEFGGRSVISRIRRLQTYGLQERYILMMLDARRRQDTK